MKEWGPNEGKPVMRWTWGTVLGVLLGMGIWAILAVGLFVVMAMFSSGCMPYRHSYVQRPGVYVEGYPGYQPNLPYYRGFSDVRRPQVYRPGIDGPSQFEMNQQRPVKPWPRPVPLGAPFRARY